MKKVQKMFRKAVSMIVAVCLMVGISNIPVYAGAVAISPTKTTDAVLSQPYYTPSQIVKKASGKPKTTVTKKKAKTVSLTTQITNKYTKKGLQALQAFANRVGLTLKTVYNAFVKMGVTKTQMKKVASNMLRLINKGENFVCCASLAVGAYLNISRYLAAVYNLAGDIACGAFNSSTKAFNGTGYGSTLAIQKNGYKNAKDYNIKTKDFISGLDKGQKAMLNVECYNSKGTFVASHALTVKREKDGKYSVYDILINGGNKITYTATEFKKFLNGKSAKGKTSSGRTITKPVYLNSEYSYLRYKFTDTDGTMFVTTHSKDIAQAAFKTTPAYKYMKDSLSIINKLLKQKGVSSLAKTWLKKAKNLVNSYMNNSKSYQDKYSFGHKMLSSMKKIAEEKASILSLVKYSSYSKKNTIYHVVYPLRTVLKNNITYKIYTKYGEDGINLIEEFSKDYKLKEADVYNIFVKNKVTKKQIENHFDYLRYLMYKMANGFEIFNDSFEHDIYNDSFIKSGDGIKESLKEIKQLLGK
ncbi:hypothetical protein [Candidatus Ruminimicrobium bovinum]|uniref:hypothetical protein n=1 Tax=Candidatus Ruminimicrobium bovinum TaxID=3242779 RepID=UPI0039B9AAE7